MSLINAFKTEVKKQKKEHLGAESRTPLAFPTGLDLLDYKNGKVVIPGGDHKKYLSTGLAEGSIVMWIGASGSGKAQPLYSKVYTPNGPVSMGDMKIGSEVLTPEGGIAKVTGIYPQGKIDNYRVTFTDGTSMECNSEHLFKVSYLSHNRQSTKSYHKFAVKTLEEIQKDYKNKSGKLKYYIPLTQCVDFKEQSVNVDPYLLGLLLGDGSFRQTSLTFTNTEEDIIEKIREKVESIGLTLNQDNGKKFNDYTIIKPVKDGLKNPLISHIRNYGLFDLKSIDKFIPDVYKYNTKEVRLSILQGLIDTDGCLEKNGTNVYFYTISEKLCDDVIEIVQSLGGIARKLKKATFYNAKGSSEKKQVNDCYKVFIKLPSEYIPYTSKKHESKFTPKTKYIEPIRKIKNIELIGQEEMQCIMIDSEEHLYLTDNFITTHNTTCALQSAFNIIRPYEEGVIFHLDLENATDKTRVAKLANQPMDYINNHYFHKNTGISSESFYETIYTLSSLKTGEERSKYEVHTGKYDERGDEIVILAPTIVLLDSLPLLVPQKITEEEELSGQMSRTSAAKMNAQVFRQIAALIKDANIILFVVILVSYLNK